MILKPQHTKERSLEQICRTGQQPKQEHFYREDEAEKVMKQEGSHEWARGNCYLRNEFPNSFTQCARSDQFCFPSSKSSYRFHPNFRHTSMRFTLHCPKQRLFIFELPTSKPAGCQFSLFTAAQHEAKVRAIQTFFSEEKMLSWRWKTRVRYSSATEVPLWNCNVWLGPKTGP